MSRFAANSYLQLALEAENQRKKHLPLEQQKTCLACGASDVDSIQGCLESFQTAMQRPDIQVHAISSRLFDAYCLQHPEVYCFSAKSYAVHLAFMACWMESDSPLEQRQILHCGMNGAFTLEKAALLEFRGELTHLHWQQATKPPPSKDGGLD